MSPAHKVDPVLRFWSYVEPEPNTGCWIWSGSLNGNGYGAIWVGSRNWPAHRFSWELHNQRRVPAGLLVRHRCDFPLCVNPDHLIPGTAAENSADAKARGRTMSGDRSSWRRCPELVLRGEAHNMAKLCEADVLEIRAALAAGARRIDMARRFGVSKGAIGFIARGETWRHLRRGDV